MVLAVPNPVTVTAGASILASDWNRDVRDAVNYLLSLQGGVGRRNRLVNSHMDIWQRGTSFTIASTTYTYTADRWAAYRADTGLTVSQQTGQTGQRYALRAQRDSGNTSVVQVSVVQPLPTDESLPLAGQSCSLRVTLSAGADFSPTLDTVTIRVEYGTGTDENPVTGFTGTADALSTTQALTTTATDYIFDGIAVPSTATQVAVWVEWTPVGTASTNDWCQIDAAQLTADSAAGYERLAQAQVLADCQRYYYQWGPFGATRGIGAANCYSTTLAQCLVPLPVRMRTTPTVTVSAVNDFRVSTGAAAPNSTNVAASTMTNPDAAVVDVTVASGLTAGYSGFVDTGQDTTNAAIKAAAEI